MNEREYKMNPLIKLYHDLEKHSIKWDNYFEIYNDHLSKYVRNNPNVLEVGIADGGSLEFWSRFFVDGQIHGVDLNPACMEFKYKQDNIHLHLGDQSSPEFWDSFLANKEKFDVIVDDGSHINSHQITTLIKLFPYLKEGGTFIIEDTHTSYWEQWGGGLKKPDTCIEFSKGLIDFLHKQHINASAPEALVKIFKNLKSITFYNSVVVLVKDHVKDSVPTSNKK